MKEQSIIKRIEKLLNKIEKDLNRQQKIITQELQKLDFEEKVIKELIQFRKELEKRS